MARISTYVKDTVVTLLDKWIGTDSNGSTTKNFTAKSIAELFNNTGSIGISGQVNFFFQTDSAGGRQSGSMSFDSFGGGGTSFGSITNIKVSKNTYGNKRVIDFLSVLVGEEVIINQLDEPNSFGIYKVINIEQDLVETNFYNVTLSNTQYNGALEADAYYGIAHYGVDQDAKDKTYVHNQGVPSAVWNIAHLLDKFPSVSITTSAGQKAEADISYVDENNLTITFAGAETGKAYLN